MLEQSQIQQFIETGLLHIENCFDIGPNSIASNWVAESWKRNGIDPNDMATWPLGKIHMPSVDNALIREIAPQALAAYADVCGGLERISNEGMTWSNAFIANYGMGRDQEWQEPSPQINGWHKDGDFFRHFLDSPEQALLTIIVFSDIESKGGGTFIAADSIKPIAEYLLAHPEGCRPNDFMSDRIIDRCSDFREVTAKAGDVILMHPFMLHTSSFNHSQNARLIINPCCSFKEPMNFHRQDGSDYNAVELAILHALGIDHLDFQITGQREHIVPDRLAYQADLREKEIERLGSQDAIR
ncbi:MAG: phytanoyl-CoA dioxygenase family protein [Planctomycetes bacterium]|nr:phytanoyl-CoA dioxygenase family protein [Planctomycetota bacterium]